MGFHEVQFPTDISINASGGPGFMTDIQEVDSGAEERISRHESARHRYELAYAIKTPAQFAAVRRFFMARGGAANGFRYKDWLEYTSATDGVSAHTDDDVEIGIGDGSETQFQLIKKYTSGGVTHTRNITKPVSGTVLVAVDAAAQTEGVDFTVDTTTGIVTMNSAPAIDEVITAGYQFDVPVRFTKDIDEFFEAAFMDKALISTNISLIELIDETPVQDEMFYLGSAEIALTANTQISVLTGGVLRVTPDAASRELYLPDETNLSTGGVYFMISNEGAYTFDVLDEPGGSTIASIVAGDSEQFVLVDISGTKTWDIL